MAQSQSSKQSQRFRLSIAAVVLAMAACTLVAFSPSLVSLAQQSSVQVSQPLVTSSLTRLSTSTLPSERLAAVSWLGNHVVAPSTNELNSLSTALQTDSDPAVRASVATALKQIAINQKQNPQAVGHARNVEPQLLEILRDCVRQGKECHRTSVHCGSGFRADLSASGLLPQSRQDGRRSFRQRNSKAGGALSRPVHARGLLSTSSVRADIAKRNYTPMGKGRE